MRRGDRALRLGADDVIRRSTSIIEARITRISSAAVGRGERERGQRQIAQRLSAAVEPAAQQGVGW